MLASNTVLQNRYRVIRELGHGGMGTVYEARDRRVNCKLLLVILRVISWIVDFRAYHADRQVKKT
jgi:serine/threonine protein kinase